METLPLPQLNADTGGHFGTPGTPPEGEPSLNSSAEGDALYNPEETKKQEPGEDQRLVNEDTEEERLEKDDTPEEKRRKFEEFIEHVRGRLGELRNETLAKENQFGSVYEEAAGKLSAIQTAHPELVSDKEIERLTGAAEVAGRRVGATEQMFNQNDAYIQELSGYPVEIMTPGAIQAIQNMAEGILAAHEQMLGILEGNLKRLEQEMSDLPDPDALEEEVRRDLENLREGGTKRV